MKDLLIFGKASQKEILKISITSSDFKLNLMELLMANGIPVASSCSGDGVCLKCILTINGEKILSCQCNVGEIFKDRDSATVILSYL